MTIWKPKGKTELLFETMFLLNGHFFFNVIISFFHNLFAAFLWLKFRYLKWIKLDNNQYKCTESHGLKLQCSVYNTNHRITLKKKSVQEPLYNTVHPVLMKSIKIRYNESKYPINNYTSTVCRTENPLQWVQISHQ